MPKVEWSQQDLLKLIGQGKTTLEIVRIQKTGYEIIVRRIHKIDETLLEKATQKGQAKREVTLQKEQEQILELIRQGKKQVEIAEIMDVKQTDISMRIKEIDKTLVNEAMNEAVKQGLRMTSKRTIEIKQEDILELIKEGKSQASIARALNVSDSTINKKMACISQKLLDEARQEGQRKKQEEERRREEEKEGRKAEKRQKAQEEKDKIKKQQQERILELKDQGKKQCEIAKIIGISDATVTRRIAIAEQEEEQEHKNNNESRKRKINNKTIQEKMDKKELTKEDVKSYREVIDDKYDKVTNKEVILLVNAYIKTGQTTEAIRFLNMTINNEDLAYLGVEKLEKAKMQVEQIKKRQMARRLLKDDMRISYIMAQTGLKETEILALKKDMEIRLGTQI